MESVRDAFIGGFKKLAWMDDTTRKAAEGKASAIVQKIGYPKYILDNDKLDESYKGVSALIFCIFSLFWRYYMREFHEPLIKNFLFLFKYHSGIVKNNRVIICPNV